MMNPDISIIIPLYNEVDNIEPLSHSIINAMQGRNYEVIFVDDGSADGSAESLGNGVPNIQIFAQSTLRKMQVKRRLWMQASGMQQGNTWFLWMLTCRMTQPISRNYLKS